MKPITFAVLLLLAVSAGGCSSLKKITGQSNDTVLQGNREEVIPPDQMTAKDPIVQGNGQAQANVPGVPCDPQKKTCPSAPVPVQ